MYLKEANFSSSLLLHLLIFFSLVYKKSLIELINVGRMNFPTSD